MIARTLKGVKYKKRLNLSKMDSCSYCSSDFETTDELNKHLAQEHKDELSRLDERQLKNEGHLQTKNTVLTKTNFLIGAVFVVFLGLFSFGFYVIVTPDDANGNTQPTAHGTVHYHGQMTATVNGEQIDFSKSQYQLQSDAFHFENRNGDRWHIHAQDVTLKYALGTLGFNISNDGETVTFKGETYTENDSEEVTILINGNEVTLSQYKIKKGDKITVRLD